MSEHLPDVKDITPEQEARAVAMANEMSLSYWGLRSAARVIVQQQDRIAELERLVEDVRSDDDGEHYMGPAWHERARAAVTTGDGAQ